MASNPTITDPSTFPTAFDHALNGGDLERLLHLYDPQACVRKSDGSLGQGVEEIAREMRNLISAKAQLQNSLRHIFRSGHIALILVAWTLELDRPDGHRVKSQGTATNVLLETEGHGWRMVIANPQGIA